MLKRTLKQLIAAPTLSMDSYFRRSSQDLVSYLRGDRPELAPPNRFLFDGSESREDYRNVGSEFLGYLVELAGLQPADALLDVGCGIGRMASALTTVIGPDGRYEGFDIVPLGIRWCNAEIQSRYPQFRFQHADVFNSLYNPAGKVHACDYRFPYSDGRFDVAIATSVFTHMLPPDMENYLAEIGRVLKPGGRCLISFLLRTPEAEAGIQAGKSLLRFEHSMSGYWTEVAHTPEGSISYHERDVLALLERNQLEVIPPIHYGSWCGRPQFLSVQDIVVARKRDGRPAERLTPNTQRPVPITRETEENP